MFKKPRYKENPYKVGDKEYFKAWWRKDELTFCEVIQVNNAIELSFGEILSPTILVRPLEGNPHMRYISLKELRITEE